MIRAWLKRHRAILAELHSLSREVAILRREIRTLTAEIRGHPVAPNSYTAPITPIKETR